MALDETQAVGVEVALRALVVGQVVGEVAQPTLGRTRRVWESPGCRSPCCAAVEGGV